MRRWRRGSLAQLFCSRDERIRKMNSGRPVVVAGRWDVWMTVDIELRTGRSDTVGSWKIRFRPIGRHTLIHVFKTNRRWTDLRFRLCCGRSPRSRRPAAMVHKGSITRSGQREGSRPTIKRKDRTRCRETRTRTDGDLLESCLGSRRPLTGTATTIDIAQSWRRSEPAGRLQLGKDDGGRIRLSNPFPTLG